MPQEPFLSQEGLTVSQIIKICLYYLAAFNDEQVELSESTIHNKVLSENDGITSATSSKRIYKALVTWALAANNHPIKPWPADWMTISVAALAEKLK